ncbi:MAG: hypothetical protein O2999_00765 [Nitrospirae bacterium]|nr:hypothetical protein [Nitrospirota bacterium]
MPLGPARFKTPRQFYWQPVSFQRVLIGLLIVLLAGCATVAKKDPVSLQNAIDLKVESLALLDKAIEPPDAHSAEIQGMQLRLQKALEYEKTRGELNTISVQQWELLADPEGNLLAGFLKKWVADGKGRSPAFIDGVKGLVTKAFDQIIKTESAKP